VGRRRRLGWKTLLFVFESKPLSFGLHLQDLLVLEKDHLLHDDSLVRVLDALEHLILLRELKKSLGAHIHRNVCTIELIFILILKLVHLSHGLDHDRVGHIILLLCLRRRFIRGIMLSGGPRQVKPGYDGLGGLLGDELRNVPRWLDEDDVVKEIVGGLLCQVRVKIHHFFRSEIELGLEVEAQALLGVV
jgi:hypothetical protein